MYTPSVPSSNHALDVPRYADEAMARLVSEGGAGRTDWRPIVETGLVAAREQSDISGLVSMVQLMVQLLDGDGRHADALSEIDHATVFARDSNEATIVLVGLKASMQSALGDVPGARETCARGAALLGAVSAEARARYLVFRKVALWHAFEDEADYPAEDLLVECVALGLERDRMFLLSWYIPFLAMLGERRRAHPWIREARMEAQRVGSVWRLADAAAFEAWDQFFVGTFDGRAVEIDRRNAMAVWRAEGIRLRDAVLRQDAVTSAECLDRLRKARRQFASAAVGTVEQFEVVARLGQGALDDAEGRRPPAGISLASLGTSLAEAEAVAHSGSQRAAAEWHGCLMAALPTNARSSLGWPVSIPRILGLLAVRAGQLREARGHFELSIEWTELAAFPTELALSRLQFGEFCAAAEVRMAERTWRSLRRQGAESLRERGYNPVPHAYAVAHSLTLSGRYQLADRLSHREVQVLALLAAGKTYKDTARELSIAAPTVQTLAHRAYEKLGVSGRDAAVVEAKRLGVL
jgi:DNA-binding CsgD family transcriptional regulator